MTLCLHNHAKSVWRLDPTRTSGLRRRFIADLRRRFGHLRKRARNKALNIFSAPSKVAPMRRVPMLRVQAFEFETDSDKVQAFMEWLQQAQEEGLLTATSAGTLAENAAPWMNTYIHTAYRQGLQQAGQILEQQGVPVSEAWLESSFLNPVHADRSGILFSRAYDQLEGITAQMDADISRVLAEDVASGKSAQEIASDLAEQVDLTEERAFRLARTEVVNAHAEASLNAYEEAGVEGVSVQAEFRTAQDDSVCPKCEALASANGGVYTLEEARGLIPVHPNCRCAWLPVVEVPEDLQLGDLGT